VAHSRTGIRTKTITAVTGLTLTGSNVFDWNLNAQAENKLPSLTVMVARSPEQISDDIDNELGVLEVRDLPITIEVREVQAATDSHADLLTAIDDICEDVEIALTGNAALAAAIIDITLMTTEIEMVGGGEYPMVVATQEWIARYSVDRTAP